VLILNTPLQQVYQVLTFNFSSVMAQTFCWTLMHTTQRISQMPNTFYSRPRQAT